MGATLSKLWGVFKTAFAGGDPGKNNTNNAVIHPKDAPNDHSTNEIPKNPKSTLPTMSGIKKFEVTEVCSGAAEALVG